MLMVYVIEVLQFYETDVVTRLYSTFNIDVYRDLNLYFVSSFSCFYFVHYTFFISSHLFFFVLVLYYLKVVAAREHNILINTFIAHLGTSDKSTNLYFSLSLILKHPLVIRYDLAGDKKDKCFQCLRVNSDNLFFW